MGRHPEHPHRSPPLHPTPVGQGTTKPAREGDWGHRERVCLYSCLRRSAADHLKEEGASFPLTPSPVPPTCRFDAPRGSFTPPPRGGSRLLEPFPNVATLNVIPIATPPVGEPTLIEGRLIVRERDLGWVSGCLLPCFDCLLFGCPSEVKRRLG